MFLEKKDSPLLSETDLIGCNVMLESKHAVHMGPISFVEGNIIEVEFAQYHFYKPGDMVHAVIYSPEGLVRFHTSVIARDSGAIIILMPPKEQELFIRKRKHPRVHIQAQGVIKSIHQTFSNKIGVDAGHQIHLQNISLGGVGFTADVEIPKDASVRAELILKESYLCTLEIVHFAKTDKGIVYGSMLTDLAPDQFNAFRAFILKRQIEERIEQRKTI